jgi:hypothetical protein
MDDRSTYQELKCIVIDFIWNELLVVDAADDVEDDDVDDDENDENKSKLKSKPGDGTVANWFGFGLFGSTTNSGSGSLDSSDADADDAVNRKQQ